MPKAEILAKLTAPRLPKVVERTRLYRQLDQARKQRPIIWITGPPGMGKTTLVASYLRARKLKPLWYQVDQGDADLATFFHYLVLAGQQAAPRYRQPLPHLTPEFLAGLAIFTRRFFEKLFGRLKPPKILVFDNVQEGKAEEFYDILATGLNDIPIGFTIILLSRELPPPSFSRFVASQVMTQFGEDDLRLTPTESRALIQLHALKQRMALSVDQREKLETQMHGWVAGLILTLETIKTELQLEEAISGEPAQVVFDYLAEEVMKTFDPLAQQILMKTAVLPWITGAMAQKLTGSEQADQVLSLLYQRRYFIERRLYPEVTYQYHPLLQSFLLAQGRNRWSDKELKDLQVAAADLLLKQSEIEASVPLFLAAGQFDQVASLIQQHAPSLLAKGQLQTIDGWLRALPSEMLKASPWLQYWLAICRFPINPKEAQGLFEEVFDTFENQQDSLGRILSWCGIIDCVYAQWSSFTQFEALLDKVKDLVQVAPPNLPQEIEARWLACQVGALMWARPDHSSVPVLFSKLLKILPEVRDLHTFISVEVQVVMYASWKLKFHEVSQSLEMFRERLKQWNYPPLAEVTLCMAESKAAVYSEETQKGIEIALKGLAIAGKEGLLPWIPELLTTPVYGALNLGQIEKAQSALHELWDIVKLVPGLGQDHYHFQAGWCAMLQGDVEAAYSHVTLSLKGAQENGGLHPEALNLLAVAQVLFEQGDYDAADTHLQASLPIVERIQLPHNDYLYFVVKAYFAQKRGTSQEKLDALQEAFTCAKRHGITSTIYWWRPKVMALLCAKALEAGIETEYVRKIIRKHHLQPDGDVLRNEQWPWPVKIWTLQPFVINVNDHPLEFSHKVPRKPLELLKAISALGGQEVSEGQLIDALWPDAEGDKGQEVFLKTLKRLRKVVGVEGVLQHRDGKVSLDPRQCWVDVWAFDGLSAKGKQESPAEDEGFHPETLEKALAYYRQPFLAQEAGGWSHVMRERLRTKYSQGALALSRHWVAHHRWDKAESCLERALEVEPTIEAFYQELITCFIQQGRQAEAVQAFERCRKVLSSTLGVEPSAHIQNLLSKK